MLAVSLKIKPFKTVVMIILAFLTIALAIFFVLSHQVKEDLAVHRKVVSNEDRIQFLNGCGWIVDDLSAETQVIIPSEFNELYEEYNMIQISQGFDLSRYKGAEVTEYRYHVKNSPDKLENVFAVVLVYNDRVIGGDIRNIEQDGFIMSLSENG